MFWWERIPILIKYIISNDREIFLQFSTCKNKLQADENKSDWHFVLLAASHLRTTEIKGFQPRNSKFTHMSFGSPMHKDVWRDARI